MDNEKIVDHLNDLLQLEHDANRAYELCIQNVDDKDVKLQLNSFLADHQRHLNKLTEFIIRHDGKPKERPDLKGPFLAGLTAVMSMAGTKNALRVMNQNETLTNKSYDAAVEADFPEDIRQAMTSFRADERKHKAWIEDQLTQLGSGQGAEAPGGEARP